MMILPLMRVRVNMPVPKFQNAYEISISQETDTLEFTTEQGLIYKIYMHPGNKIIPGFVFTSDITYFGFLTRSRPVNDSRVLPTVMNVIIDLLEDPNAVVAFLHSSANGQDRARERYFRRLFNTYGVNILHKTDFELEPNDGTASIIYRQDNININALRNLTSDEIIARMEIKDQFDEFHL